MGEGSEHPLRIEAIESWILELPAPAAHRDFEGATMELVGVTVTAEGMAGLGLTYTAYYGGGRAVKALIDHVLSDVVVGAEVEDYRRIWDELERRTHRLGRGISMMAISAVDIALWDLMAKARGVPLATMLGRVRDRVPLYGSGKGSPLLADGELLDFCIDYAERGFAGIKMRVGYGHERDLDKLAKVRAALGERMLIMCDANERLDLPTALWLAHRLAAYGVYWFEEPIRSNHIGGFRRLSDASPVPIALGEHLQTRWDFAPFVEHRAASILQPNATTVGGVTEIMRVAELAGAYEIPIAPHFLTELHVHVAAAVPNSSYLEYFPFLDEVLEEPLPVENGHALVPERPGHGMTVRGDAFERYRIA